MESLLFKINKIFNFQQKNSMEGIRMFREKFKC